MKGIWIAQIYVGGRRLVFLLILLIFFIFYSSGNLQYFFIGFFTSMLILTIAAVYFFGIYIRRHSFWEYGQFYEINDFININNPSQNARILSRPKSKNIDAKIFHSPQKNWAFLNGFHDVLKKQKIKKKPSVLILGSGVGALTKNMMHSYPGCHIEAIDKSPIMISMAKKFFLSTFEAKQVTFLCQDAYTFIRRGRKKYDIILIDLFENSYLSSHIMSNNFIRALTKLTKESTIILVNFQFEEQTNISYINDVYAKHFPKFRLLGYKHNFIGTVVE